MLIAYSGKSAPTAQAIADEDDDIFTIRSSRQETDINYGRRMANSRLNPDTSNSTNKRRMRELFESHDVPMPKLVDSPLFAVDQGRKIVGRPDNHMKGRGLWICETRQDVLRALKGTRRKKPATHFMEYIEAPHEYRAHIFNGKSIRISEKKEVDIDTARVVRRRGNNWTIELDYLMVKPTGPVKHVRKAAKAAVAALGLDFGAVDILATDTECWVLEVNSAPGLGGSVPRLYAETFKKWYEEET